MYKVVIKKSVLKNLQKLPKIVNDYFYMLIDDLRENGPIQINWNNFSKLDDKKYHCHLTYHYVACWRYEKDLIRVEVYYAGSREKAPY